MPIRRRVSFETIGSISAIVVALASLFVAGDEARSVRRQQAASVLPILKVQTRSLNDSSERSVLIRVENVGVGPAFIDAGTIRWDGEPLGSVEDLRGRVQAIGGNASIWTAPLQGQVVGGGSGFDLFAATWTADAAGAGEATLQAIRLVQESVTIQTCYCSVYDDCWRTEMNRLGRPDHASRCEAEAAP